MPFMWTDVTSGASDLVSGSVFSDSFPCMVATLGTTAAVSDVVPVSTVSDVTPDVGTASIDVSTAGGDVTLVSRCRLGLRFSGAASQLQVEGHSGDVIRELVALKKGRVSQLLTAVLWSTELTKSFHKSLTFDLLKGLPKGYNIFTVVQGVLLFQTPCPLPAAPLPKVVHINILLQNIKTKIWTS